LKTRQKDKQSKDRTVLKTRGEHMCYGWVNSSCSTSRTRRVTCEAVRMLPDKLSSHVVIIGYVFFYLAIKDEQWNRNCLPFRGTWATWDSCCSIFSFLLTILWTIVCPFVPFVLSIVLPVHWWFTAFDYPFGFFTLFLDILQN